jgi:hypothetical protein
MAAAKDVPHPTGLTSDDARHRLEQLGANAAPDTALHPLRIQHALEALGRGHMSRDELARHTNTPGHFCVNM